MWQHLIPRFNQELEIGEKCPYDATNITECQRSAGIVKRLRQNYIDKGKKKIGSLIAGNFKVWGYTINFQHPTNIQMVTNIIKSSNFENDFLNDPDAMLCQLYSHVNLTVEFPAWKVEVVKAVNCNNNIAFMHPTETNGAKGNRVHCLLRIISAFVNKWVFEKITNACDNNLKCSIRKDKNPNKRALGYATLLIPGSSSKIFVRHLQDSTTFSGESLSGKNAWAQRGYYRVTIAWKSVVDKKLCKVCMGSGQSPLNERGTYLIESGIWHLQN